MGAQARKPSAYTAGTAAPSPILSNAHGHSLRLAFSAFSRTVFHVLLHFRRSRFTFGTISRCGILQYCAYFIDVVLTRRYRSRVRCRISARATSPSGTTTLTVRHSIRRISFLRFATWLSRRIRFAVLVGHLVHHSYLIRLFDHAVNSFAVAGLCSLHTHTPLLSFHMLHSVVVHG